MKIPKTALHSALMAFTALLTLGSCSLFSHQSGPSTALTNTPGAQQAECERLREQIRTAQQDTRRAPTTSVDENIVGAAQAKADQRVQDLQAQYDAQDCATADKPPDRARAPQLPSAPGGPLQ